MFAKGEDLHERWARRSTQLLFRSCPSNRVVVAIEEPAILFAKGLVIRKERTQHERLEKPGRMPGATSSGWHPGWIAPSDPQRRFVLQSNVSPTARLCTSCQDGQLLLSK